MTRDDISNHVILIMDRITAAYTAVQKLQYACQSAASDRPELDVVMSDIQTDLGVHTLLRDLNAMYCGIERSRSNLLPAHLDRLTPKPVIRTTFVNPPIPIRTSDWCACVEGHEEDGPYGWGRTEAEAIADLEEKLEDGE